MGTHEQCLDDWQCRLCNILNTHVQAKSCKRVRVGTFKLRSYILVWTTGSVVHTVYKYLYITILGNLFLKLTALSIANNINNINNMMYTKEKN